MLLLAGRANSHRWWERTRSGYEQHFRVITLDCRGTGGSRTAQPPGRTEWSTRLFAQDAAAVLDAAGVRRASVHGTSMGGRIAQMLALHHPERVEALVLSCSGPGGSAEVPRDRDATRAMKRGATPDPRAALHELFYTPAHDLAPEQSTLLGDPTMSGPELLAHAHASDSHDAADQLSRISAPTLVLHGSEDRLTPPENSGQLAARLPEAELFLHEGGRHGFFDEFQDEVTPRILDFLHGSIPLTSGR